MPYILNKTARKKSEFYKNIMDSDEQEHLRVAQKELKRMQISGSNPEGTFPVRDENGVLLSFQSPFDGEEKESIDEPYQHVRLKLNQKSSNQQDWFKFFGTDLDFTDIYPPEVEDEEAEDVELLREEYNAGIERNNELNKDLTDAINDLNKKIAELNQQPAPATTSAPEPKPKEKKKKKKKKKWYKKIFSDVRLKTDIEYVGSENGFNTYEFRYIWGTQRYKGVMAQEVMRTNPQAVDKLFGIYRVDYDELGVEFTKC